jgi:hypothetical protein
MAHMTRATRASGQCWRISEYFMLKQCLENKGEGLLHARISSKNSNANLWDRTTSTRLTFICFRKKLKVMSSLRTSHSDIHSVKMLKFFVDLI